MGARKTFTDFINSAKSIYGDKYDYSKVIYKNTSTKVEIICPKHGSFLKHLQNLLMLNKAVGSVMDI